MPGAAIQVAILPPPSAFPPPPPAKTSSLNGEPAPIAALAAPVGAWIQSPSLVASAAPTARPFSQLKPTRRFSNRLSCSSRIPLQVSAPRPIPLITACSALLLTQQSTLMASLVGRRLKLRAPAPTSSSRPQLTAAFQPYTPPTASW